MDGLVDIVLGLLFVGTGRRLLALFGKRPHTIAMFFTGMAFWAVIGLLVFKAFDR
ncbi:hypothetical protein KMZ93_06890 [Bradyrhizobium sediminis]|uniref:Uncharacterized protein n=1 Tax=Bradyrhizobium sediminis TaxID=2840469 RepID=A0A975RZ02_9BRAD|nr:hypothetical protein [Bradyrhizobium sediminis]QWG24616.1 hypothetical protein KMZ93_06890 [Bradyrhizobium sediminis]